MRFENKSKSVLVIDDEPFQTEWLTEYFRARGFEVVEVEDLQSALDALDKVRYRYVVIDLSIPFSPALAQPLAALGSEFYRYPGLMAARRARTTGHNTFQVIVYSVHDSADVESYSDLIVCKYILKGRPRELKDHIERTIHRMPRGWRSATKKRAVKTRKTKKIAAPKKRIAAKKKTFYARYPFLVAKAKRKS